ncbi:MAG: S9 family peptidase [Planctomycetes bacterium]|nr:S9 family peptidase [Planctomycetota bacterium]
MGFAPLTVLLACSAFVAPVRGEEPHPFSVDDMLAMRRIGEPALSPDGQWIVFSLRTTDLEANKGRLDLWLVSRDGKTLRRLTTHDAADSAPKFARDGKSVFFLSTRSGSQQLWRIALDGGEPRQVTDLPLDVGAYVPFGDDKRFALALDVFPDAKTLAETAERDAKAEKSKLKARVYDELMFRHWDSWEDHKRSHVFVWTDGGGAPLDLMKGLDADAPMPPFGGSEQIAVSPDGSTVVFVSKNVGREAAWSTNLDLWVAPSDGSAAPRCLTEANAAQDDAPTFSPDGKWLAYLAMSKPGFEADRQRVMLRDWKSGALSELAPTWDRSPSELAWSRDGRYLLATADDVGNHALFALEVATDNAEKGVRGTVHRLVAKGTCASPLSSDAGVVYLRDTLTSPAELEWLPSYTSTPQPITHVNAERLAATKLGAFEQFSFKGWNDETVWAFLVKPIDFDASKKYPVAYLIHGGPQGSFGDHFHYRWNPQFYAGAGYAAVMVDFHGSTGYGQAFSDAISGDWGGKPYEDLMKGLDAALAKYSFLDGSRCAALGASYGGYMINWLAGHTDRFKAFVCHSGNLDERLAYYDTEELWFPEWDHGGLPWEKPDGYTKHNPIDFVQNWKTPTLVTHGELDFRVVYTQGLSTFTALQRKGVPSKLVVFPDENHWILKPQNSKFWHETVIAWLDRWCKP